ncbi:MULTISPECIES: pyridoxal 5'-phosphate synthase [Pectobacterium]|uniref:pyridoxal 5'-phosphate synthase n=1 Tax=Pectobacterium TaxID=122277 RepID=UPI00069ED929|nr:MULTISPECIES: pyridoxal 5'-phosphate synthase [Pectobacterium]MBN3190064.1 pyridoxal 5'-phosphate synthase [Pectobacterium brasiliense]MCL6328759.1 pyridoxal 5'-phosphate synthase [Pectobacterium carotovorum subsp. carotovorum]MCL6376844.1 pyridoxal 5'-phosphate synthase [Pectobacterium brasiliense]
MMGSSDFESMSGKTNTDFLHFHAALHDPIARARAWVKEAMDEKVREPRAMVLTTANEQGEMSSRVMAILDFTAQGILFATHSCSRKIQDVQGSSLACGHFYWKELGRQLSVSGHVIAMPHEVAIDVWNQRPVPLHAMSTVSYQSQPLLDCHKLRAAAEELENKGPLPCPERFSVYQLIPQSIEFWASSSDRLHRRLRVERGQDKWRSTWLQP